MEQSSIPLQSTMSSDVSDQNEDDVTFELSEEAASLSETIKQLIEDGFAGSTIPLLQIESSAMAKVIEYNNYHVNPSSPAGNKAFDYEFLERVKANEKTLFDVLMAANFLNNLGLRDLLCQGVGDMMKGKAPEQIRQMFRIPNDLSPEEDEVVRRENAWDYFL